MFWFFRKKEDLKKEIKKIKKSIFTSFSKVKKDILTIKNQITSKESEQDKRLEVLESKINLLSGFLEGKKVKKTVFERSKIERVQSFNRSVQSFMNVQTIINKLTPAQKQVVFLLLQAGGPMNYETIAKNLDLSVVTARRHLNDIIRTGVKIKQKVSVRNRRKMFSLDKKLKNELLKSIKVSEKVRK